METIRQRRLMLPQASQRLGQRRLLFAERLSPFAGLAKRIGQPFDVLLAGGEPIAQA